MNDSIFVPNYNISLNTTSALEDIERQLWLVERVLLMPKHEAWMRREVQVKRASATTQIEGANLDEEAVSNLLKTARTGRLTEDEQANVNALEAYKFIDYLSDQPDIPIDELVVRQLNRYFLDGAVETLTPGVYRKGLNTVGEFTPPDQGDVPSLMRSFALWLREDNDAMHPIVKAGIAHIHMVTIHPFWGRERTNRPWFSDTHSPAFAVQFQEAPVARVLPTWSSRSVFQYHRMGFGHGLRRRVRCILVAGVFRSLVT